MPEANQEVSQDDGVSESIAVQRDMVARMKVGDEDDEGWHTPIVVDLPDNGPLTMTLRELFDHHARHLWIVAEAAVRLGQPQDTIMDLADYEAHWNFLLRDQRRRMQEDWLRWG